MSATTCYIHPDKAANTSCERCNRPICPADHRTFSSKSGGGMGIVVEKKMVCPECHNILKSKEKSQNRIIGILILIVTIVGIGFMFYIAGVFP